MVLMVLMALPGPSRAQVSASPSTSLDGNYTVSWSPTSTTLVAECVLSESFNEGTAVLLSTNCSGSQSFTAKTAGTYYYTFRVRASIWYKRTYSAVVMVPSQDVGVLAGGPLCAGGSAPLELFFDNEDTKSPGGLDYLTGYAGWLGASSVDGNKNTHLRFCRVDGRRLKPLIDVGTAAGPQYPFDYAVLKLGERCPVDSAEFGRFVDNEDNNPISSASGDVAPNYLDGNKNTMMRFCLFRFSNTGGGAMQQTPESSNQFPVFGFPYGVFAAENFMGSTYQTGFIDMDDEDGANVSYFDIDPMTINDNYAVNNIISGNPLLGSPSTRTKLRIKQVSPF